MGYVSITRLSLVIQEKISKLNAGNLSMEELDELKELTTELNERVIVLQYKAAEAQLLKQAGDIVRNEAVHKPVETPMTEPIKLNLGNPVVVKPQPVVEKPVVMPVADKQPVQEIIAEKTQPVIEQPVVEQKPVEQPVITQKPVAPAPPVAPVSPQGKVTLVERMQKTKINDLKTAIGLNQKFLFMNFLFEGENTSYNDAIEKLNAMPTVADARHYIRELAYIYNWNFEDENVILFTEYVERRHM